MYCKIEASYVNYEHPVNRGVGGGPFAPYVKVHHTEYRSGIEAAETAVFKYLNAVSRRVSGTRDAEGRFLIPKFTMHRWTGQEAFSLCTEYHTKNYSTIMLDNYRVDFTEVAELPEGAVLARGAFKMDTSYDGIVPPRKAEEISDWKVDSVNVYPFKEGHDMVKVVLSTPSGPEREQVNCEVKEGKLGLRNEFPPRVKVGESLWKEIEAKYAETA